MANATSSALRADDPVTSAPLPGADGPAFGSLSTLGGPRKFKKKPVLVLDPEELAKAHMMFQDASAELLGEDVERPERSAPVLGLAPMDFDDAKPDKLDVPDDGDDIDEDDLPSAEDVLRMTASRAPLEEPDEAEEAAIAAQLEGLDVDRRIFPVLPLKSEDQIAAEEEAERFAVERMGPVEDGSFDDSAFAYEASEEDDFDAENYGDEELYDGEADANFVETDLDDNFEVDPVVASEDERLAPRIDPAPRIDLPRDLPIDSDRIYIAPFDAIRAQSPVEGEKPAASSAKTFPVSLLPEPEAELETSYPTPDEPVAFEQDTTEPELVIPEDDLWAEPEETLEPLVSTKAIFSDEPFLDFPTQRVVWVPQSVDTSEVEDALPEPVADLPQATPDTVTPPVHDEMSNRFEWAYEDEDEENASIPHHENDESLDTLYAGQAEPEYPSDTANDGSYTEVEEEEVDGYAFMYANSPRGRTIHALAEGESNSLRAKLIKERADALADQNADDSNPSLWTRFTGWVRGLFG